MEQILKALDLIHRLRNIIRLQRWALRQARRNHQAAVVELMALRQMVGDGVIIERVEG